MQNLHEKKKEATITTPPPPIVLNDREKLLQDLLLSLENQQVGEDGALISLPLFRVTGTSMDIENLVEKLEDNTEPLGGENSHEPAPGPLQTQWKTRLG